MCLLPGEGEAQETHCGHCIVFAVLASVAGQIPTFLFHVCCFVTKLLGCVCIPYFPCCPEIMPQQSNLTERRNERLLPVRKQRRMEAVPQPLSLTQSDSAREWCPPLWIGSSTPPPGPFTHSRGPPSRRF